MAKQSDFEKTLSTLGALTQAELLLVRGVIDDLLAVMEEESAAAEGGKATDDKDQKTGRRGYIEHKIINGYGPYAYLRVWKGKTLTSTYLGKVKGKS